MKKLTVIFIILFCSNSIEFIYSQTLSSTYSAESVLNHYIYQSVSGKTTLERARERSKSADAYQLMALRRDFASINLLIKAKEFQAIELGMELIDNIVSTAKKSKNIPNNKNFKDDYLSWTVLFQNSEFLKETALYESYSFFYISEFLYLLKNSGWTSKSLENMQWWDKKLEFVEKNIWEKWLQRSIELKGKPYWYFLRQRTHMGSHWAGIAMFLNKITQNDTIKKQTKEVREQYDLLLKRNLKIYKNAYIWNATYDNVSDTDAQASKISIVQDVSHGNHVIAYVTMAHELGSDVWKQKDMVRFSNTVLKYLYNPKTNSFFDNVDGTHNPNRPGWGNFVGDGWVKLGKYNKKTKEIFLKFMETPGILKKYHQEVQFKANLIGN